MTIAFGNCSLEDDDKVFKRDDGRLEHYKELREFLSPKDKYEFKTKIDALRTAELELDSFARIREHIQLFDSVLNELKNAVGEKFDHITIQKTLIKRRKAALDELHGRISQCWDEQLSQHVTGTVDKCCAFNLGSGCCGCQGKRRANTHLYHLVQNLLRRARRSREATPISFGVLGSWGLGKTTCKLELKAHILGLFEECNTTANAKQEALRYAASSLNSCCGTFGKFVASIWEAISPSSSTPTLNPLDPVHYIIVDCNVSSTVYISRCNAHASRL